MTRSDGPRPGSDPSPARGDAGPPVAFTLELVRHQDRLRGFIRCLLINRRDADDVLQDVNVLLVRKAADFRPGSDFWAWASQVARYQVLTQFKKQHRDRLVFSEELLGMLAHRLDERPAEIDSRLSALRDCLEKLPEPQRQLLVSRYRDGASMDVIAWSLGRSAVAVRKALSRIREALLGCIEQRLATEARP